MNLRPITASVSKLNSLFKPKSSALDSEMMQYAARVQAEEQQKQKRIQPLQFVLDVLSRGQYLTANIADEVEESFRTGRPLGESTLQTLKAAWEGITGKRKGDWETLLFGGKIEGESDQAGERPGWIPGTGGDEPLIRWGKEGATGLAEGILRPRKLAGLAANVLLDPTTYISFGATSVAKNAAKKYADDVVRLTLATMGPDDLAKFGLKAADKVSGNYTKIAENIIKTGSEKAKRELAKIYDDAYKFALRNTPENLSKSLAGRVATAETPIARVMPGAEYVDEVPLSRGLKELLGSIGEGYAGAGQRKVGTFFGKDFGVSERYPGMLQGWDKFRKAFEESKVGGRLGEAWWSVMNKGPVGSIRKALGIRNPYQQMLHLQQRGRETATIARGEQEALKLRQVFQKFDDDIINKHRMLRMEAGDTGKTVQELFDSRAIKRPVVYHGTPNTAVELGNLDINKFGSETPGNFFPAGFSFTPEKWYAEGYAGKTGKVLESNLDIRNPYIWDANNVGIKNVDGLPVHGEDELRGILYDSAGKPRNPQELAKELKNQGYDSFVALRSGSLYGPTTSGTPTEFIIFDRGTAKNVGDLPINIEGFSKEEIEKILDLDAQINDITGKWYKEAQQKALETGQPFDVTEMAEYFPQQVGRGKVKSGTMRGGGSAAGTGAQGFTRSKAMKVGDHVENNAQMFEYLMGDQLKAAYNALDPATRGDFHEWVKQWVIDKNLSETTLDLEEALMLRGVAHAKYLGRMDAIADLRQYGIPFVEAQNALPQGVDKLVATYGSGTSNMGLYKVDVPGFENMLFDEDVASVITEAGKILSTDKSIQEFAGALAKTTAWWKTWVTANPGFHARNAMSNNITGFLKHGAKWVNPDKHMQAAAVTMYALHPEKYADLLKDTLNVSDGWIARVLNGQVAEGFTGKELGDYIRSTGLVSKHSQVSEEIGKEVNRGLTKLVGGASRSVGDVIEGQSKVMSFMLDFEDIAKQLPQTGGDLATRLAQSKRALEYADQEAKKWFIDYGDLTDIEKNVFKKVIPFYTWIRKNLANQIAGLTLHTNMYSLIPKVRGAMTNDDDFDYSLMPEYMENMGYYPVGQTAEGGSILRWANIPLEDVNKIPVTFGPGGPKFAFQEVMNDVVSSAHPLLKTFLEMATGKDIFRQRDIKEREKAPGVLQYLNNSPKVVAFLDGALRLAGRPGGMQLNKAKGYLEMDGRLVKVLENNVPVLRTLDNMLNSPQVLGNIVFPEVEDFVEKLTGKKDTVSALNEIFNIVSRTAGFKFREIQMAEEEERKQVEMLAKAEKLRSEARKQLPGYQVRSAKALQARQKRAARYF